MPMTPYPFRQSEEQRLEVKRVSKVVKFNIAETMRRAIDAGLPVIEHRFATKTHILPPPSSVGVPASPPDPDSATIATQ